MTTAKTLVISALLSAAALGSVAHATVTEKFSQTYPLNANGSVTVDNVNGRVEVIAWDKNEVGLEAEKIASSEDGLQRIKLVIDHSPERFSVKTELEKKWKFWGFARAEVRYTLRVPAGASLRKIDTVNAAITVRGVTGYVDLDTVNGAIDATGLAGGGRFDTVNGSIHATFTKVSASDRIVLDAVNGSCTVTLPAAAAFDLKADSVNGRINCDFPITLKKNGRRHLAGSVNGGGADVVLDSVNGGLAVRSAK